MESNGFELSTWLTLAALMVLFFVVPGTFLEIDRRRRERQRQGSPVEVVARRTRQEPASPE